MANKPFLALVIPAPESTGLPPGQAPGGPGQSPGLPPGQVPDLPHVMPPIHIEPPPPPDVPEGSRLILVFDGESWQWRIIAGGAPSQPVAPTPSPKQ